MRRPHIILLMMQDFELIGGVEPETLMECDDDGDAIVFDDLESAKKYQDDYGVDGRVVPIPLY
jgi:hypothetical protein